MNKLKRLKYSSYAVTSVIIALAIFIVVNLIAGSQNWKADVTKNKVYSLSEQTKTVLSNLKQDINVYVIYIKGSQEAGVNQLLENYKKQSSHMKVESIDIYRHPEFEQYIGKYDPYQNPGPIWVVFKTSKKTKVFKINELYSYNEQTGKPSFLGEQSFTSAVRYLSNLKIPTIYFLQGHGELTSDRLPSFDSYLKTENYSTKTVDLLTQKSIPSDADVLMVAAPVRDFLPQEIQELNQYFNAGGKGLFFIDPTDQKGEELPLLVDMLKKWGITYKNNEVIEGDASLAAAEDARLFIPQLQSHEITDKINQKNLKTIIAVPSSISISQANGYIVQSLLKSSDTSWAKAFPIKTLNKEAGDVQGPLDLAAVVSKKVDEKNNKEMRVAVFGTSSLISDQFIAQPRFADKDLILNTTAWLRGTTEEITIHPKEMVEGPITITQNQKITTVILVMIFIPGIVLIIGIVVWMRRRHL